MKKKIWLNLLPIILIWEREEAIADRFPTIVDQCVFRFVFVLLGLAAKNSHSILAASSG